MMLLVTTLGLGAIAFPRIPLEFITGDDPPVLSCWIPYPGAAPSQVEQEVAIPAEGMFRTMQNVRNLRTSSSDNGCYVFLLFDWDTDMSVATAEMRDRIERLRLQLPDEIDRLYLHRWGEDDLEIMWFALFGGEDQDEIAWLARTRLKAQLERIDGVSEIGVEGNETALVYIDFDKDAMRSLGVGLYETINTLRASSLDIGVGELIDGQTKHYVRVEGELSDLEVLRHTVVGPGGVRLEEVATVEMRRPPKRGFHSMDGQRGVYVWVRKESQANTVVVCDAVREELENLESDPMYEGTDFRIFEDQSQMVKDAIFGLRDAGQYGGLLALIVLFVFLRRIRATLLVALAIPASMVVAFIYMYFAGSSFNVVTMSALIISVGLLVDNSIVVIENIYRHRASNPDPVSSAREGATEVSLAIITATSTTLVVFIPVMYMTQGEMAIYMKEFAKPIGVALVASLILALTVIPLAASRIYRRDRRERHIVQRLLIRVRVPRRIVDRATSAKPFNRFTRIYVWILGITIHQRLGALAVVAILVAVTFSIAYPAVGSRNMPDMDMRQLHLHVEFDQNYGIDRAEKTFARIEAEIDALRDELGIENVYMSFWSSGGYIRAYLLPLEELEPGQSPSYSTEDVQEILAKLLPDRLPGAEIHVSSPKAGNAQTQTVSLNMLGDDTDRVKELAKQFAAQITLLPSVTVATTNLESGRAEIQIGIDEALASQHAVNPRVIAQTVGFALRGTRLPDFKQGAREIPVWAQFQETDRANRLDLENVSILTPDGELVSLDSLARFGFDTSPNRISREDRKSVARIVIEVTGDDLGKVRKDIDQLAAAFDLPRGYSLSMGFRFRALEENENDFRDAILLAVLLMYLLMAALFESWLLPLSILTTVPLAFIGVYWSMYFTDTPMDTIALIGGILMCGIIVNNGIVIVDHINQLRRRDGLNRREAILQAGHDRIRPVLMTALTTILGCIPLAIGSGTGRDLLFSLGRALAGGLTMGTFLTLFVVPLSYSLIDDLQSWIVNYLGSLAKMSPRRGSARSSGA